MENHASIPPHDLILSIKKEPKEEDSCINYREEPLKSLVLRFVRDKGGTYSVVPLIKPDPFFEEHFEDLCHDDESFSSVKIKEEYIEGQTLWGTNSVVVKKEYKKESDSDADVCKAEAIGDSTLPSDINDKIELIERHVQKAHSESPFDCRFCDRNNFRDVVSLDTHLLSSHRHIKDAIALIKGRIFSCNLCKFQSLKRSNYRRHLTTHGDKELKKCLDSETYDTDIKMALRKTQYNCYHCSYATVDKGSMVKHVRLHKSSKFKPFSCTVCKRKFNEKNSLDSHIVKRHFGDKKLHKIITNRIYECDLCHFRDVNKSKLVRHKTRHVKKERKRRSTKKTVVDL